MSYFTSPTVSTYEVDATPNASALIEGHRDFGYSLETALADIIDNSITANATTVNLIAVTSSESPYIAISDNGNGMSEEELINAMRLGSKSPTDNRCFNDLGRFGLGLKTASFSQCRKLTVLTRKNGVTSCATWDLDRIAQLNNWMLTLNRKPESIVGYELLEDSGTVVIWEKLDRLAGGLNYNTIKRSEFINAELARAERHLRLVFHRFLQRKKNPIYITLNNIKLKPIDPLASEHPSTQKDPEEVLMLEKGTVRIRCFTLPHHNKMTREEWDELGGTEGHLKSQGLYVYRENRLIIAGDWLRLTKQTELTKLCRIAIDIPNTMDSDWKIDVKKASAQLPPQVKERLKKIVERFVGTSKRTYRSRGRRLVDEERFPLWQRISNNNQISFRPNYEHPFFTTYAKKLPEELRNDFFNCIRLVGSSLPVEALHAELLGNAEAVVADALSGENLRNIIYSLTSSLISSGIQAEQILDMLQLNPSFKSSWDETTAIFKEYLKENLDES